MWWPRRMGHTEGTAGPGCRVVEWGGWRLTGARPPGEGPASLSRKRSPREGRGRPHQVTEGRTSAMLTREGSTELHGGGGRGCTEQEGREGEEAKLPDRMHSVREPPGQRAGRACGLRNSIPGWGGRADIRGAGSRDTERTRVGALSTERCFCVRSTLTRMRLDPSQGKSEGRASRGKAAE